MSGNKYRYPSNFYDGVFNKPYQLTNFASKLGHFPSKPGDSVARQKVIQSTRVDLNFSQFHHENMSKSTPHSEMVANNSKQHDVFVNAQLHHSLINQSINSRSIDHSPNQMNEIDLELSQINVRIPPKSSLSAQKPKSSMGQSSSCNNQNIINGQRVLPCIDPQENLKQNLNKTVKQNLPLTSIKFQEWYNNSPVEDKCVLLDKETQHLFQRRVRSSLNHSRGNSGLEDYPNSTQQGTNYHSPQQFLRRRQFDQNGNHINSPNDRNTSADISRSTRITNFSSAIPSSVSKTIDIITPRNNKNQQASTTSERRKKILESRRSTTDAQIKRKKATVNKSKPNYYDSFTKQKRDRRDEAYQSQLSRLEANESNDILEFCERRLNSSISMLLGSMEKVKNVHDLLQSYQQKYEFEGNREMSELFKGLFQKKEQELKSEQKNSFFLRSPNKRQQALQQQPQLQKPQQNQKQKSPEKPPQIPIVPTATSSQFIQFPQTNQALTEEQQLRTAAIQNDIQISIKKVEKYLDVSVEVSKASTLDLEQTHVINTISYSANDIFLKPQSVLHKLMNLITPQRQAISIDLLFATYENLPFNYEFLENNGKSSLIGSGSFGKVYQAKLFPVSERLHPAIPNLIKSQDSSDEPEDLTVALKVTWFTDLEELDKKCKEFLIENYLLSKEYRHFCRPFGPAYCLQKDTTFELMCCKELGGFNLNQILLKRQERFMIYNEHELLHIFRQIIVIIKELHERQIAHRDIKPNNFVYSTQNRSWKLIDFGVSLLSADMKEMKEYYVCGTPLYLMPRISEMYNQQSTTEVKTKAKMSLKANDMYSLGITFMRIKKLLMNPFDQKYIKAVLASEAFDDETEVSNVIIKALTQKDEAILAELNLSDLIVKIDVFMKDVKTPFPNDQSIMNDSYEDFTYSKLILSDEDYFERALAFKKLNKNDLALNLLIKLISSDTRPKLKANCYTLIGHIYQSKGNYPKSLEYLEEGKKQIQQIYPEDSIKFGQIYEELGHVENLLCNKEQCILYYKAAFRIYQRNPLDSEYRISKLKQRLESQGINLNVLSNPLNRSRKRDPDGENENHQNRVSIVEGSS